MSVDLPSHDDLERVTPISEPPDSGPAADPRTISRRRLIKALVASGLAAAGSTLPGRWLSPAVEMGVLPAHAQVSPTPTAVPSLPLTILASWDVPEIVADIDLHAWDPGGTGEIVFYGNLVGPTATHSGDNINFDRNWEEVTVPAGGAADGVYTVWVHSHESGFDIEVTVEITANGSQTFVVTAPPDVVNIPVAQITYPGGIIAAWAGPVAAAASVIQESK